MNFNKPKCPSCDSENAGESSIFDDLDGKLTCFDCNGRFKPNREIEMNSIETLKKIFDEIDYPCYVEFVDCIWKFVDDSNIYYNTDDSTEDLENEDGNTYDLYIREGSCKYDNYLIVNGDDGCGNTITYFFNLEKEIK